MDRHGSPRPIILPFVLLIALSSCAVPPAITIASLAADGMSAAATGKTVSDHALSAATEQDCALWRLIELSKICVERKAGETEYASFTSADAGQAALRGRDEPQEAASPSELAAVLAPLPEPSRSGVWPVAPDHAPGAGEVAQALAAAPAAAATPVSARGPAAGRNRVYLVLGSFTHRAGARAFARVQDRHAVAVVPAKVKGRTVYRVVVGPLTARRAVSIRRELTAGGLKDSWTSTSL